MRLQTLCKPVPTDVRRVPADRSATRASPQHVVPIHVSTAVLTRTTQLPLAAVGARRTPTTMSVMDSTSNKIIKGVVIAICIILILLALKCCAQVMLQALMTCTPCGLFGIPCPPLGLYSKGSKSAPRENVQPLRTGLVRGRSN